MSKMLFVLGETFRRQIRSWSFWLMVLAPFLIIGFSFFVGKVTADNNGGLADEVTEVAVIAPDAGMRKLFDGQKDITTKYRTEKAAKKAVGDDDIAGYVKVRFADGRYVAEYHGRSTVVKTVRAEVIAVLSGPQSAQNIATAKLTADQVRKLRQQPEFVEAGSTDARQKKADDRETRKMARNAAYMILVFAMYFILIMYAATTAQEIGAEKGTKIMEVLFSSMPAKNYFYGKMLGLTAVIVLHISIYAAGGGALYALAPGIWGSEDWFKPVFKAVNMILGDIVSVNLIYVLLMIVFCTVVSALCGALVTRIEDTNKAVQPVMYLVIAGFVGAMMFQGNADSVIVTVLSYIPGLSAFFMPLRVINDTVGPAGIAVSLILFIALVVGTIFGCARIYPRLILQTDDVSMWRRLRGR